MATGTVEIVNGALLKIGAGTIMSLDDNVKEAKIAKVRWDLCRQAVLRMHPWNCAIKRVVLAATTDAVPFEYTYKFNLPGDCLRVLELFDSSDDYKVEGRSIYTDDGVVNLKYIYDVTDAAQFDSLFSEALATYLAWDLCQNITQDNGLRDQLWKDFLGMVRMAKFADATEDPALMVQADDFLEARLALVSGNDFRSPV